MQRRRLSQGARPIVCSNPLVEVGYVASSVGYALPLVNWATSTNQGARPIVCSNPLVEVGYVASSVGYALPLVNWATSTNQSAYYAHDNHTRVKHAPTHT
jgi:hypothetical protein